MDSLRSASAANVIQLRELLRDQFPEAHPEAVATAEEEEERDCLSTGISRLDEIGLEKGRITELVAAQPGCGAGLLIGSLLEQAQAESQHLALIDGCGTFDPASWGATLCQRLFWVRCREALQALKAADLLLRDGNLPHVLLDLQFNPAAEFQELPDNVWYRLRGLVEQTGATLLVLTPTRAVGGAHLRLTLERRFDLDALDVPRTHLREQMAARVNLARSGSSDLRTRLAG